MDRWPAGCNGSACTTQCRIAGGSIALLASGAAWMAVLLALATPARAQVEIRDVRSAGIGDAYVGLARSGYATALDPAALAPAAEDGSSGSAPSTPSAAEAFDTDWVLPSILFRMGLGPVTLGDLADYAGRSVPHAARVAWLDEIRRAGEEIGGAGADATMLSHRIGRWGIRWSTSGGARTRLNPDASEVLLFGNAGRTGDPGNYEFDGSSVDAWAISRLSVGVGARLDELGAGAWGRRLAVGVTLRAAVGHGFATGRDAGSSITGDPVVLTGVFPVVRSSAGLSRGRGFEIDLSVRGNRGPWTGVVQIENAASGYAWNERQLSYRPGVALLGPHESLTDNPARPVDEAPPSIRERVEMFGFGRTLRVAGARTLDGSRRLAGSVSCTHGSEDGVTVDGCRIGVGAEDSWGGRIRASVGATIEAGSPGFGAGSSIRLGRILVDLSAYRRFGRRSQSVLAIGTAFTGRPGSGG